jgi:hypothetical protein
MAKSRGTVSSEWCADIIHNISFITKEIDAKELLDYFVKKDIFTIDDCEVVTRQNPDTRLKRNHAFMTLLLRCGPRAYGVFIQSLKDYPHVVERILNSTDSLDDVGKSTNGSRRPTM